MVINVIGSNFSGKTTLIQRGLALHPGIFLDIRTYREQLGDPYYQRYPDGVGSWSSQWRILAQFPRCAETFAIILSNGGWALAHRYWKHFYIQAMLLERAGAKAAGGRFVFLDEGVVKKLYEAVPWVDDAAYPQARERWIRIARCTAPALARNLEGLIDRFIYVSVAPEVFLERARQREAAFVERVGALPLLNRYRIHQAVYQCFVEVLRDLGWEIDEINNTDGAEAEACLLRLLSRLSRASSPNDQAGVPPPAAAADARLLPLAGS